MRTKAQDAAKIMTISLMVRIYLMINTMILLMMMMMIMLFILIHYEQL